MNKLLICFLWIFLLVSIQLCADSAQSSAHKPLLPSRNLIINPLVVDFGDVLMNEIRQQLFELTNQTDMPKNIEHYVTADDGSVNLNLVGRVRADTLNFVIMPFSTEMVLLTFTPQSVGLWSEFTYVYDQGTETTYGIPLTANVLPAPIPHLMVNPIAMNFGNVRLTETVSNSVDLFNPTDTPVNISHYVTADDGSVNLNLVGRNRADSLYYTIQPDEHKTVIVEYTPQELGEWSGNMIVADVTNGDIYQIPMTAMVILPVFVSPPTGELGNVILGQSKQISFSVHNASDSTLNISHYVTADDGSVNLNLVGRLMLDSLSYTVQPNATESVILSFAPSQVGNWTGIMHIYVLNDNSHQYIPLNALAVLSAPKVHISFLMQQVKLSWQNVIGALQYEISQAERPDTTFTYLETIDTNSAVYTPSGNRKFYQVKSKAPD